MSFVPKSSWLVLVVGLAAGLALPAASAPTAWDQAKVTSLAQQLGDAARAFQAAVLREPEAGPRLQKNARTVAEQSQMLGTHLAKGDGKDKTKDYYRGLKEVTDDTVELQSEAPFGELTASTWAKVADLVSQLAAYY
jgi:hypothetical protein